MFIGQGAENLTDEDRALLAGRSDRIHVTGHVEDDAFQDYVACADIAVQLRRETRGETSRAVLDFLAAGVPVIVNDVGSFREIDAACVLRLPGVPGSETIADAVAWLLDDPAERARLGAAGRDLVARENGPEPVARAFLRGIERFEADIAQRDLGARLEEIARMAQASNTRIDAAGIVAALIECALPALGRARLERFETLFANRA